MKKLIVEDLNEGLEKLLGHRVLLMSAGYFYEGKLVGVNETCVKISDPHLVYETGSWDAKEYSVRQKMHTNEWYVATGMFESFGVSKNA